ncbi:NUDIX domain-containing protein, partial [Thioclava sp. BHET1]
MRIAETVTFGGSGLDRAAELRGDGAAQIQLWSDPATRCLAFWRGKPLIAGDARDRLGLLAVGHAALAQASEPPIFLGRDDMGPLFAVDISAWEPEEGVPAELSAFLDPTEQIHPDLPGDMRFAELRSVMARLSPREAELAATARALFGWHQSHGFCARCGHRSEIEEAGWRRGCPSCKAQHFPRTDPVVIMLITLGNSLLLGRSRGWPEGMYSLLAGFIEPGETLEAAVRREVFEEAGIRVGA